MMIIESGANQLFESYSLAVCGTLLSTRVKKIPLPSAILFNMNKKTAARGLPVFKKQMLLEQQRTLSKLSRNQTWQPPITKQDDDKEKKVALSCYID